MAKKQILHFGETDHSWYEAAEKCTYGIANNNSMYIPASTREKTFSVISKGTQKVLTTKKTRAEAKEWIEKKTGKKIVFVSMTKFNKI